MKKSDLKSGMIVQTRNGGRYLVLKDCETKLYGIQEVIFVSPSGFLIGTEFTEDLTFRGGYRALDIVRCFRNEINSNFFENVKSLINEEKIVEEYERHSLQSKNELILKILKKAFDLDDIQHEMIINMPMFSKKFDEVDFEDLSRLYGFLAKSFLK